MTLPRRFGSLLLLERVAIGSASELWAAATEVDDARRVVKRLLPGAEHDVRLRVRLERERRLDPDRDPVIDVPGVPWLIRKYHPGLSLAAVLRSRRPDEALAARLLSEVQQALEQLHAIGVVHGDLHPRNVLLPAAGPARLIDYGAAAALGALERQRDGRLVVAQPAIDHAALLRLQTQLREATGEPIDADGLQRLIRDRDPTERWSRLVGETRSRADDA